MIFNYTCRLSCGPIIAGWREAFGPAGRSLDAPAIERSKLIITYIKELGSCLDIAARDEENICIRKQFDANAGRPCLFLALNFQLCETNKFYGDFDSCEGYDSSSRKITALALANQNDG